MKSQRIICSVFKFFLIGFILLAVAVEKGYGQIYKDASVGIELRVQDLLAQMTLEDKCRQIDIWHPKDRETGNPDVFKQILKEDGKLIVDGIGFLQFDTQIDHARYASNFNAIQRYLVEKTRLGIPAISNGEGCHGFVGAKGTVFPVALSLGSTWDKDLVRDVYTAIGKEMRQYGITHAATPVLDLLREPRYGRCDEMLGEDPYLVAELGVQAINGLQGEENRLNGEHLIACAKHFGAHGQPEGGTNLSPANLSERVLRETHFYPFEMAVKKANVRTVMASYNEIDGVPSHANEWLLNDVLRGEWGFTGYVISDYDAVRRMIYRQHVCHNQAEAAQRSISAGMDFECPSNRENYCFNHLPDLIKAGRVDPRVLDSAVARVLRNKFMMGLFENPYISPLTTKSLVAFEREHRTLAREAAEKGMILLKNEDRTLPFAADRIKRLAVIGPNADEVHYGTYSNEEAIGISLMEGLEEKSKGRFEVLYAEGFKIYENDTSIHASDKTLEAENARIEVAVNLAKTCDAVLLVMGGSELTSREGWGENRTGDRVDLTLLGRQNDLAKEILALGKKTAVLLINGRPLAINYLAENAPAIIEGWYLGQEQGRAVANVLFGEVNPSGKLSVTIPRSVGQLPVYYNHKPIVHERSFVEGSYSPLYPFGYGLSYTQFEYTNLKINTDKVIIGEVATVSVEVTNVGDRSGEEIVQLYIHDKVSSVTRPVMELKDFERIVLNPGETKQVSFRITSDKLQFYDIKMNRVVEPGEFELMLGTSSKKYLSTKLQVIN